MHDYERQAAMQQKALEQVSGSLQSGIIGRGFCENATTLGKPTALSGMASRLETMSARVRAIISNLNGNADRVFGCRPESGEDCCPMDRASSSLAGLDRALRDLDSDIGVLADAASRFNEI